MKTIFAWQTMICLVLVLLADSIVLRQHAFGQSKEPAAFVTNNVGDSITSFTINPDGSLNFVGLTPSGEGPQTITLTPDGRYLAVGHGTISSTFEELRIFAVHADATLTEVAAELVPDSPLNAKWLNNQILAVTETSLSGPNQVITYRFDPDAQTITEVDSEFTGDFNTSIAVTGNGGLVFANNTFGTSSIFAIAADVDGNLSAISNEIVEPLFAVAISASPDGEFLYGAGGISGTGNEILVFEIEPDGMLNALAGTQSPGQSPKVIDLTDDGTILVAGHGTDSTVQSFLRDKKTGLLIPTGFSYDVGSQGNLGDLVVMGDQMLVTDESTSDDGLRGLLSFRINADGSFTQLGPLVDTGGGRPEYIAAWPGLSQVLLGDVNLDGIVNLLDVEVFVERITTGEFQAEADCNLDGMVSLLDVDPFVAILANP
jgi:6-phosphogluconolactonase (cycloisomerase 2 family)